MNNKQIISYYKKSVPKTKPAQRRKAHSLLGNKLCSCIKKVQEKQKKNPKSRLNKKAPYALCVSSVLKRKNLKVKKFKCKGGSHLKDVSKR